MRLSGKKILLGITGCIAAYKAGYVLRALMREGAEVRVVMTKAACEFVTPLTFEALSGRPVAVEMFPRDQFSSVQHVFAAEWADLILVAPATASIIAKSASGVWDDLLSTTIGAAQSQVIFSPAMNTFMWNNPVTQQNIAKLKSFRHEFIDPEEGDLASWAVGPGRFPEPDTIVEFVVNFFGKQTDFVGKRVLVTAGPTYEYIDPVRFIGNPSTGAMGFALADAARKRGADVTLISGPTQLEPPVVSEFCSIISTDQLAEEVLSRVENADIVIMAAAPSDYSPANSYSNHKIKKSTKPLSIKLSPTMDILKEVGKKKGSKIVVGFALETEKEVANARKKMADKKLDMIVVNNPNAEGAGFGTKTNKVTILSGKSKAEKLPLMSKRDLADEILNRIKKLI
ncbi:MAG: bifunctional phosphopantothenoylcysteine decarboxylase/phosphopantothenate--cysteine ligase CoaBC [Candidatus Zixiibacteriota bacterium]